ncbi:hypothetical protein AGDE_15243 [Angomonas deanei]|uniref:Uncharacterized protein n=1 Tax=Angomonas deanei TaxID=59799 RepID=A0A7G2CBX3_9TRYP|nr:hypothetical protein AGDE_15243 [Angomonas deanei]CAD2217306.1 hypothetical protein, conserved [Angomonas deanei]|eukprot:EPY19426.1 hypothetical protein AGDE_15243 [Angomonas deanei]
MAEGRLSYNRNEIAVYCAPRCGVVPPFSDVRVNVHFTVLQVGPCASVVDCYIPEIAESAPTLENAGNLQLEIRVTGVGPSVHTSTEYLDFGLVEMGKEVEASFTVTNDNPTPIEFDMQDPLMREPPRFVFIPPSFRLGPGDSVEVTVYRKGVSVEDEQTFFEVVVRDGATVAIETRATIQASTMVLDDAYLNFGEVPEGGVERKGVLFVEHVRPGYPLHRRARCRCLSFY